MIEIIDFLNMNSGIAIFVSSISALISAIAVIVALYFNAKTQNQYQKSLEPQISMRVDMFDGILYLLIQNLGRTAAQDLRVIVKSIENNGANGLALDKLFSQTFELFPNESTQAMIAISGENASTGALYPKVILNVSYRIYKTKKIIQFERSVTFSKVYDTKVLADVNLDLNKIESALTANARASVRTANYFDGHQVTAFDELNILADKTLKNDMCSALGSTQQETVKDRTAVLENQLKPRKPRTKNNK